ncbi:MAG TPA: DUF6443 domain-containing protein [Cytophagaceae bacterium]
MKNSCFWFVAILFLLVTASLNAQTGTPLLIETTYEYSTSHLQPIKVTTTRSDGKKDVNIITYPSDYSDSPGFTKDLVEKFVLSIPVERVTYILDSGISQKVVSGEITSYKSGGQGLIDSKYLLKLAAPLDLASFRFSNRANVNEIPPSGNPAVFYLNSSLYEKRVTFDTYDSKGNLLQYTKDDLNVSSYQWGYNQTLPIAEVKNATSSQFAYNGFEMGTSPGENGWEGINTTINPIIDKAVEADNVYSGKYSVKVGPIASGNNYGPTINITPNPQKGKYRLSAWVKTPVGYTANKARLHMYTIKSDGSNTAGYVSAEQSIDPTNNEWKYFETILDFDQGKAKVPSENLSIRCFVYNTDNAYAVYFDDLRIAPVDAQLSTYSYIPEVGILSSSGPNSVVTNYEYDGLQRLKLVRDYQGNVVKKIDYNYKTTTPATDQNFVAETEVLLQGLKTEAQVNGTSIVNQGKVTTYFDGLGREIQVVTKRGGPGVGSSVKDLVQPIAYDIFGNQPRKYLPYLASTSDGAYKTNALNDNYTQSDQYLFYQNTDQKIAPTTAPYAQTVFESSPLNRPMEQGSSGTAWQPGTNKTKKLSQSINGGSQVKLWKYNFSTGSADGTTYYAPGTLTVTNKIDEDGNSSYSYHDQNGRMVYKVQSIYFPLVKETYYVYDDLGNLRYVIQPEGVSALNAQTSKNIFGFNDDVTKKYIFSYKYDARKRVTQKRIPGGPLVYLIYDKADRLVMTQDENLRQNFQWNFIKYDGLDRPIQTGEFTYTNNGSTADVAFEFLQKNLSNSAAQFESRTTTGNHGYTDLCIPLSTSTSYKLYSVNYYDNYTFLASPPAYSSVANFTQSAEGFLQKDNKYPIGALTGVKAFVLNSTESWLWQAHFYDMYGRVLQTKANNHLNLAGFPDVTTNVYKFTGVLEKTNKIHKTGGGRADITVDKFWSYDQNLRLVKTSQQVNGGTPYDLSERKYNGIGQLIEKNLHKAASASSGYLQSVDYTYNTRGWLTNINNRDLRVTVDNNDDTNDMFGMDLFYEGGFTDLGGTARYNGNISGIIWSMKDDFYRGYGFTYDGDNRMLNAKYGVWSGSNWTSESDRYTTNLTYDRNGNILTMRQNGLNGSSGSAATFGLMDDMNYFYSGNKLIGINDKVRNVSLSVGIPHDFNDGQTDIADAAANNTATITAANAEYTYDFNGNLVYDKNKGVSISYNVLNSPTSVDFGNSNGIIYTYAADGRKLNKKVYKNTILQSTTDYVGEFVYTNSAIDFFHHEEGRCVKTAAGWQYQYDLKDHLGNVRVTFDDGGNKIQTDHYYPFGGRVGGLSYSNSSNNKFLFNGKELQDDAPASVAFDLYDYGARYYDPQIGRWHSVDPLAEKFQDYSPYNYGLNNPISMIDPDGREAYHFEGKDAQEAFKQIRAESNARNGGGEGGDKGKKAETEGTGQKVMEGVKDGVGDLFKLSTWTNVFKQTWEVNKMFYTNPEEAGRTLATQSIENGEAMMNFGPYEWSRFGTTMLGQMLITKGALKIGNVGYKALAFKGNNGFGFRPFDGPVELMYRNPSYKWGGTLFSYKGNSGKFRLDFHGNDYPVLHFHTNYFGLSGSPHRGVMPWNFAKPIKIK